MKLIKVKINKYKSFLTPQEVMIDENITRVVGKNESGKTALLEALAKTNYFESDPDFKFNPTFDFPKNEWKAYQDKLKEVDVISCTFKLDKKLIEEIKADIGPKSLLNDEFSYEKKYEDETNYYSGLKVDEHAFLKHWISKISLLPEQEEKIKSVKDFTSLKSLFESDNESFSDLLKKLNTDIFSKIWDTWDSVGDSYVSKTYIDPNLPVFWYFDEYYSLPSRISLDYVQRGYVGADFSKEELAISKALLELAHINIADLVSAKNFEAFISELEATSNAISDELFEYWTTNKNLEIKFEIEVGPDAKKYLNIRI